MKMHIFGGMKNRVVRYCVRANTKLNILALECKLLQINLKL
jgi:hypothetical protein